MNDILFFSYKFFRVFYHAHSDMYCVSYRVLSHTYYEYFYSLKEAYSYYRHLIRYYERICCCI